ncbi:MAG: hypothetical protein R3256_14520 [Thalassovita sp.]|nr:hypothetical protein [Thalassovita sp.]
MSRKFIATILAASLTITSISAVPAHAGNKDLARFLAGATALVIIGSALGSDKAQASTRRETPAARPQVPYDHRHDHWHRDTHSKTLPGYCRSSIWTPNGRKRFLDRRCVNRNYDHARQLPKQCQITAGSKPGHGRRGYSIRCLKKHGFEIARN